MSKKNELNRRGRRAEIASMRGWEQRRRKSIIAMVQNDQREQRAKALKARIAKASEKSEKREAVRKEIAQKEGVNWKRVVLTGKIIEGQEVAYKVKASERQGIALVRKQTRMDRMYRYIRRQQAHNKVVAKA